MPESAMLVGLLKAPSRYAPTASPDRAVARARSVIQNMVEAGYIKQPEATTAETKLASAIPAEPPGDQARYFTDWVLSELPDYTGATDRDLVIRTSLDPHLQHLAEHAVTTALDASGKAAKASQGAMVVMAPDGTDSRHGRRPRLCEEPVQPGHPGAPPAGLVVQADGLSGRAGKGPDAGRSNARFPDHSERLAAPELRRHLSGSRDPAGGLRQIDQHGRGQARRAGGSAIGRRDGAPARHHHADRRPAEPCAGHVGSASPGPDLGLCGDREQGPGGLAPCDHRNPRPVRPAFVSQRRSGARAASRLPHGRRDDRPSDLGHGGRRHRPRRSARPPGSPARPAPARISATPGSSASPPNMSPGSGSATTMRARWRG